MALALYDNFSDLGVSASQWTEYETAPGVVDFSGNLTLDMSPSVVGKLAYVDATNFAPLLVATGDFFRFSLDFQFENWSLFNYWHGWFFNSVRAGFAGYAGNQDYRHNIYVAGGTLVYGTWDIDFGWFHIDVTVTSTNAATEEVSVVQRLYQHNAAWNASPETYRTSGTLRETITATGRTLTHGAPVLFSLFAFGKSPDGFAQNRDSISFDNVWTENEYTSGGETFSPFRSRAFNGGSPFQSRLFGA